jgi:voltage-gated potassium channel
MLTMTVENAAPAHDRLTPFQVVTLVLSVGVLLLMFAQAALDFTPAHMRMVEAYDLVVCAVFFFEFLVRWHRAPSKLEFMKWGWIDLVSCIPVIDALRWGRLVRIAQILRLLRAFRSVRMLLIYFLRNERLGSISSVMAVFGLVVAFAAITVLHVEGDAPASTIKTPGDAFWWAIVTVTTVGYGDHLPVTAEGRLVAGMLMIAGVGLFGTLSGLVASVLVSPRTLNNVNELAALTHEIRLLREKIERLEEAAPPRPHHVSRASNEDTPPS